MTQAQTQPELAYRNYIPPGRQIIRNECEGTEVTREDVLGDCRAARIVEIRRRIIKLLHSELHWGLSRIAHYLHMDHSSIWHALKSPRRDYATLPQIYGRCKNTSPRAALAFKPATPVAAIKPPEPDLTPEQLRCRAASDNLILQHGRRCYAQNVIERQPQMRRPPFEGIVK